MITKNHWWYWKNAIPKEQCEKFLELFYEKEETIDASYMDGKGVSKVDDEVRKTSLVWVEPDSDLGAALFYHMLEANKNAGWNFDVKGIEHIQLGKYEDGGHYKWHRDVDNPDAMGFQRKLSISLILNDPSEYEGGVLEFGDMDDPTSTVELEQGGIVVFPSFIRHRVTPVTSGTRFSAVTWMRGSSFR